MKKWKKLLMAFALFPVFGSMAIPGESEIGTGDAGAAAESGSEAGTVEDGPDAGAGGTPEGGATDNDNPDGNPNPDGEGEKAPLTAAEVQKMIQSETDKVRTEYAKKLKIEQDKSKKLEREKLTDSERAAAELADREAAIAEKEAAYNQKEMMLAANDELIANSLDSEFREFVIADTSEKIKENVIKLKTTFDAKVEAEVQRRFKAAGYNPGDAGGGTNIPVDEDKLTDKQWEEKRKKEMAARRR